MTPNSRKFVFSFPLSKFLTLSSAFLSPLYLFPKMKICNGYQSRAQLHMYTGIISIFTLTCSPEKHDWVYNRAGSKKYTRRRSWEDLLSIIALSSAEKSHLHNDDKTWVFDQSERAQGAMYVITVIKHSGHLTTLEKCGKYEPHFPGVLKCSSCFVTVQYTA